EVVDTPDPRAGPKGKLPFIEDAGLRMGDTSLIVDYLAKTRGVDLDTHLNASQRGIALLVQRTLEEHYAFVTLYTHFIRADGWRHTRASFDSVPTIVRALVASTARGRMRKILWMQGFAPFGRGNSRICGARLARGASGHGRRPVLLRQRAHRS